MQKKYYILITVILVLIVIGIVYISQDGSDYIYQDNGDYIYQVSISQKAIDNSNPDICKQVKSYVFEGDDFVDHVSKPEAENKCYYTYAKEKLDITICERISLYGLPEFGEKCGADEQYASCIYEIQKSLGTFSKENCDKLKLRQTKCGGWYLSKCSEEVVKITGDTSICDEYFEKYTGHWGGCTAAST